MKRIARRAAALVGAAALAVGLFGAPASANGAWVYQNASYTAGSYHVPALKNTYHTSYFNNGYHLWDAVTSLKVDGDSYLYTTFWQGHFCSGAGYSVIRGGVRPNVGTTFNDSFSSSSPEYYTSGC